MAAMRTFGRMPTLREMKEYYARDDVLSFLYDECQMRNIDIAFRRERWPIDPASKTHLREIIEETIEERIERAYRKSADRIDSVRLGKFDYLSFHFRTSIASGERLMGFDVIFQSVIRKSLADMSPEERARILVAFMLHGKSRLIKPSAEVLLKMGIQKTADAIAQVLAKRKVEQDRVMKAANVLKQMEPSIEEVLSERIS